jgi:puromycin-sensitive aminopeptidase
LKSYAQIKRIPLALAFLLLASLAAAQRLPQLAVPENYTLTLAPDFAMQNFAGEETIRIRVLKETTQIVLNAVEIDFQDVTVTSESVTQTAAVTLDEPRETATLRVEKPLPPGAATIHIRYTGVLGDDLRGFYLGADERGQKYAATQFEATDARRAFPSFDEPTYKATFDLTVVAPQTMVAISNTPVVSDGPGPVPGKHTVRFATTPKMSSYLLALVVGDFEYVEGSADGVPIRVYATPGRRQLATFALQAAENILRYYQRYFSIKYPYGKLDLIGLPDFSAGAMENTACITFRENLLLLDEHQATLKQRKLVASVIAHEMAHMWFGDLVTMQWWDDVWLNEGFATWMSGKALEAWKPEWKADLDDVHDAVHALDLDSLHHTHPIHQSAETPRQILALFDTISYDKAAAVLRMVESYLGPEAFRPGVNQYLTRYAYGNATSQDFWNTLAQVSGKPVDAIMSSFVNQPGAPVVDVKSQCVGNSTAITLEQQRYFYDRARLETEAAATENAGLWQIPVCLKAGLQKGGTTSQRCFLLAHREQQFTLPGCSTWVLANAGAAGYYRSNYGPRALHALADVAETALTPQERIMLLADAWAAVRVGRESVGQYLAFSDNLGADRNPAVMAQLLARLDYIGNDVINGSDRESYRRWVRRLLDPIAQGLGTAPKPGENAEERSLRAHILRSLATTGRDPAALAEARRVTLEALKNTDSIDPELISALSEPAAINGDAALYDEVLANLKHAQTPEGFELDLKTLAAFTDPRLLQRTLDYAISPGVRSQDTARLVAWVMENPAGRDLAWNFVRLHWLDIMGSGGPFGPGEILQAVGSFCDVGARAQVGDFFSADTGFAASRTLQQSLERIGYCVDLKARQQNELALWLDGHGHRQGTDRTTKSLVTH